MTDFKSLKEAWLNLQFQKSSLPITNKLKCYTLEVTTRHFSRKENVVETLRKLESFQQFQKRDLPQAFAISY